MKPLRLLIAVVVLVALGGFVYYTKENPPADNDERVKIVDVEQDDLQEVSIARPGNDTLTVKRGEDEEVAVRRALGYSRRRFRRRVDAQQR